jgi:hypothetical protein
LIQIIKAETGAAIAIYFPGIVQETAEMAKEKR